MPPAEVTVNVPEQIPPTVTVAPKITMPRRRVKREIEYDPNSGRPKSLLDTEEFIEQEPSLEDEEKGGVHRTRGSVSPGGTYGNMFDKKRK